MEKRTPAWIGPVAAATILGAALIVAAVKVAPLAEALALAGS